MKVFFLFIFICFLYGCSPTLKLYSHQYKELNNNMVKNIVICRAVESEVSLSLNIAKRVEEQLKPYLDTIVGCEKVDNLLQEAGIFTFDYYTDFMLKKVATLTHQRFILTTKIESLKESHSLDDNAHARFIYTLYDATYMEKIFVVSAHIADRKVKNYYFQGPIDIRSQAYFYTTEVTNRLLEELGYIQKKKKKIKQYEKELYNF